MPVIAWTSLLRTSPFGMRPRAARTVGIAACAAVGVAVLAACGAAGADADREAAAPVVRDSAGIHIVESPGPVWRDGEGWTVDPEPRVRIGTLDGDDPYLFEDVTGATRLPDGRIVLVESGTREIRVFDAAGRHLNRFGGIGEGPGEFRAPPDMHVGAGDTLVAFDRSAFRYSWFTLDGVLVRDLSLSRGDTLRANFAGVFSNDRILLGLDGSFLHVGSHAPSNTEMFEFNGIAGYSPVPDEIAQRDIRLGLVLGPGEREVVFGRFPWAEGGYVEGPDGPMGAMRVENEFYVGTQFAVHGDPVRVHVSTPGRREIRTFDAEGELVRIIRQTVPLRPLPSGAVDDFRETVRDSAERTDVAVGGVMALFDQIEFTDSLAPYARMVADAAGNLWVLENELEDEDGIAVYQVFDADGGWLGPVRVPRAIGEVEEIGEDYLLTIRTDDFEVPYVHVHALDRAPAR